MKTLAIVLYGFLSCYKDEDPLPIANAAVKDTMPASKNELVLNCRRIETDARIDSVLWNRYILQKTKFVLDTVSYPISAGNYKLTVLFLIEKTGTISNVKPLNDPGFGLAKLAEQIIREGPGWTPATLNGRLVRSYKKQTISFEVPENKCIFFPKGGTYL